MAQVEARRAPLLDNKTLRRWVGRAFLVTILAYLVVIGYLIGASEWEPYGVNIAAFLSLTIVAEVILTATVIWIFKEDSGIWPAAVADGWAKLRGGSLLEGLRNMLVGAWDVSLIDLRLRTPTAILLGRINRVAALVPLVYLLSASAGGAPWGMRSFALLDIAVTLIVWTFMELVMVSPGESVAVSGPATSGVAPSLVAAPATRTNSRALKVSSYEVRPVALRDLDRIEEIERIKWRDQAATREMVRSRLDAFPEGQLGAIHVSSVDGLPAKRTLVAWCTAMVASESQVRSFDSWDRVTSNGTIRNNDLRGNVVVGVNLTSVTEGGMYILSGEALASVVEWGKAKLITGSRLNGFVAFNARRKAEGKRAFIADEYARLREIRRYPLNEERVDAGLSPLTDEEYVRVIARLRAEREQPPLQEREAPDYVCSNLRGYMSIPGVRMVEVVPRYFNDPASENYGVLVEWHNPLPIPVRHLPWLRRWAAARIRREVQAELDRRRLQVRERAARRAAEQVPEFLRKEGEAPTESTVPVGHAAARSDAGDDGAIPPARR